MKGAYWLDAPVSGGSEGAARGTLSIMVGGDSGQLERARPYLEAYGTTITHVGPTGAGQMAKLVNQAWWRSPSRESARRCSSPRPGTWTWPAPSTR